MMRQNYPSAARLRLRFGETGIHQRNQFVAIMFELLVADAGDTTELLERRRTRGRNALYRGIVQHDIGRRFGMSFDTMGPLLAPRAEYPA